MGKIETGLTSKPEGATLGIRITENEGHSVFVEVHDTVGDDADGAAIGVGGDGRYAEATVLLVGVDAEPVVAVCEL